MMFGNAYKIATVWGIPIKIHMSLIVVMLFVALRAGSDGGPMAVLVLLIIEFGLFVSIALHELGHSFVAIRKGCRVREITLMFMGGAAQMDRMPKRPMDEALMALAGPLVSLVLGLTLLFGGALLPWPRYVFPFFGLLFAVNLVQVIGLINLMLVAFNLLPSFPMDGGRVLRAVLTPKIGRLRATFIAARLGKIMAVLFGLYGFLAEHRNWVLVAIAFFIYTAAGREYRVVQMEEAARRGEGGGPFWNPFAPPPEPGPPPGDADVVISPPPYARNRREEHVEVDVER
jgi:Zn-dependent protease